ncbi:ABC transporter substrate-binding protein [Pikeienuella piscinae]|uniref:ABC transporter substrate-binding protein n=1 Tax=Pikeienuella piscinae TaxID=2748098 RepID=A0A7L5BZ79_9RHOB|nr:ABC transporter substrate-binding protein [Pikeienuella piscinae]QIE57042.1 ABC transporter substrate-binding protein [Pikeienuella piscinae]
MTRFPQITRRGALTLTAGALALASGRATALTATAAEDFVESLIKDLRALVEDDRKGPEGAAEFLALLERKSTLEAVGRFAMGRTWRDMSEAQQAAYQAAFRTYISNTYQRRFGEYSGEDISLTGVLDAGQKGVLVKSVVTRPSAEPVTVEWLVTDRTGSPLLSDIIFEGVSLAITLRETFGGMVDKRNGDIDLFIADLAASHGA